MWVTGALWVVFAVSVWLDPRKFRTGLYLLSAVSLTIVTSAVALVRRTGPSTEVQVGFLLGIFAAGLLFLLVLAVFNVFNGITMIRKEGHRPANLLSLLFGLGLLGYLALITATLTVDRNQHFDLANSLLSWVLVLGFPAMYLGFAFTAFLLYAFVYGRATLRFGHPVDAVIVLGTGLGDGRRVTPLLAARLDRGRDVLGRSLDAGRPTVIVPSGGQGPDEQVPEAVAMADYLIENGTDADRILLEGTSTTTGENLRFSRAVLVERGLTGPIAVVTNNFHAFRAALLMRRVGLKGYSVGAPTARYFWPSAVLREFFALLRDHPWVNGIGLGLLCVPLLISVAVTVF